MSSALVIARPYAKAVFESACDAKSLTQWSEILLALSQVVSDAAAQDFFSNPASTLKQQKELLMSAFSSHLKEHAVLARLVDVLVEQGRVWVVPTLFEEFQALCADYKKTMQVQVRSFNPLSSKQEQALIKRLSQRLQREVSLEVSIDPALLGGAVIQAGDLVIDGSVRGKLNTLYTELVA